MEINPEYLLEGLMMKLKLQYLGHLIQTADSLEKPLMLGKIEGRKKRKSHASGKKKYKSTHHGIKVYTLCYIKTNMRIFKLESFCS